MKQHEKRSAGVWLDQHHALLITHSTIEGEGFAVTEKIASEENHSSGSEHSMNNAKQGERIKYFKTVAHQLLNYDELLLFGPGTAQEQFLKFLQEDGQFKKTKISLDTANQLTEPQVIARVRTFFQ
ncbi:MAG: hypothetical protein ABI415_05750 [Flavitalea sp.]